MADNVTIPATGTGTATPVIASDDIGGIQHQRVKVSLGPNGTAADLDGDATGGAWVQGGVAHDGVDTGKPVKIGGKAVDVVDSFPADVAPGDRTDILVGLKGQVFVAIMGQDGSANPNLTVLSTPTPSLGATLANVSASVTSVQLVAQNVDRRSLTIWNDSSSVLYVKFGTTASATDCTVKLVADDYYEVPGNYSGRVDGIWVSATGAARMTEITTS